MVSIFLKSLFRHWFYVHEFTGSECFNSEHYSLLRHQFPKKKKRRHVEGFCSLKNFGAEIRAYLDRKLFPYCSKNKKMS